MEGLCARGCPRQRGTNTITALLTLVHSSGSDLCLLLTSPPGCPVNSQSGRVTSSPMSIMLLLESVHSGPCAWGAWTSFYPFACLTSSQTSGLISSGLTLPLGSPETCLLVFHPHFHFSRLKIVSYSLKSTFCLTHSGHSNKKYLLNYPLNSFISLCKIHRQSFPLHVIFTRPTR